jgi:hypothetical protein
MIQWYKLHGKITERRYAALLFYAHLGTEHI